MNQIKQIDEIFSKIINSDVNENTLNEFLNTLSTLDDDETTNYLSQLVYLYTRRKWPQLGNYLLKKCGDNIAFYEIIKWSYEAYTEKERQNNQLLQQIELFDQKIEEAMVNQISNEQFQEKETRSNYVNSIQIFVACLTQLSLHLKSVPIQERQVYLRRNLIKANRALESFRRFNEGIKYCQGIILPFKGKSQMVVRIIDTEAQSFNTKKRVPYKIVVETVDMQEYEYNIFQPKLSKFLSKDSQAFLDFDVMHQFDYTVFENFLEDKKDKLARQQQINQNKKRFNSQFPLLKKQLIRRQSCIIKIQSQTYKQQYEDDIYKLVNKKLIHSYSQRNIDQNQFLDQLIIQYPNKIDIFIKIKDQLIIKNEEIKQNPISTVSSSNDLKINGPFQLSWQEKKEQIQQASPFGYLKSYTLRSLLIKGGDDLRQEQMMMQCIKLAQDILQKIGLFIQSYDIIITSVDSGILEFCNDTVSLDILKKQMPQKNLKDIYIQLFGDNFEEAQHNFVLSLSGYSLLQYLFQIKDRHNGNILINNQGHIIHIDFGFILTIAPGGIKFESAPFKLTKEYIDLLGGQNSNMFHLFKSKLIIGFLELQKHFDKFAFILDTMRIDNELPCLEKFDMKQFKERFKLDYDQRQIEEHINKIVSQSANNQFTKLYDDFQKITNGIIP